MTLNSRKDPSAHSGHALHRPTDHTALDETAEPEGQFPSHDAPDEPTEDAHVGATEEQIGDRTGPGAGYDETSDEQAASLPQGGQGMGQGRGANPGQQKPGQEKPGQEKSDQRKIEEPPAAKEEEKRQDPPVPDSRKTS